MRHVDVCAAMGLVPTGPADIPAPANRVEVTEHELTAIRAKTRHGTDFCAAPTRLLIARAAAIHRFATRAPNYVNAKTCDAGISFLEIRQIVFSRNVRFSGCTAF